MGQDKNENSNHGLRRVRQGDLKNGQADWGGVDAKKLVNAIQKAASKGGALRFGYTRDGGAYAVGVYAGGEYFTDYIRPGEDIDSYLEGIAESFEEYQPDTSAPPMRRGNKRV